MAQSSRRARSDSYYDEEGPYRYPRRRNPDVDDIEEERGRQRQREEKYQDDYKRWERDQRYWRFGPSWRQNEPPPSRGYDVEPPRRPGNLISRGWRWLRGR